MTHPTGAPETRHCIKCGRAVGADESICSVCNRAGMATPSATQYHGTIALAIVIAVAGLAWAAGAALEGVGPYAAEVRGVTAADIGYDIGYAVTNEGTRSGRAKCHLTALDEDGRRLRQANEITGPIGGGETLAESISIPGLAEQPGEVTVSCS
jgi:predicted nucleic acid-binding Zn ribbon protein